MAKRLLSVARFIARGAFQRRGRRALAAAGAAASRGLFSTAFDIAALFKRGFGREYDLILAHFGPVGVGAQYLRSGGLVSGELGTVFHGFDITIEEVLKRYAPHYRRLFEAGEFFFLSASSLQSDSRRSAVIRSRFG